MGFLIDTCIWVAVERGSLAPADVGSITGREAVFISPVTIAELKYGVEATKNEMLRQKRRAALNRLLHKPLLRIDGQTGEIFGSLAATLKSAERNHLYRVQDLWLASQAVQHTLKFLTYNNRDFQDIPELKLVAMPVPLSP